MIVVPALHPAHELIARVERLVPGTVHRAAPSAMSLGIGGKAVNVARFAAAMGEPVRLVVAGDPVLLALAVALRAEAPGLEVVAIPTPGPSRTDLAIVDESGDLTVVNGMAAHPGEAVVEAVRAAVIDPIRDGDVLVLAGSTPEGTLAVHPRLALEAARRHAVVVVDASGPWLRELLTADPFAVKISAAEAGALVGATMDDGRPAALTGPAVLGITEGEAGLRAWLPDGSVVRVIPPSGVTVVNPLGAGDAVTAGLAIALARGDGPLEGLVLGTAMAAASIGYARAELAAADVEALRGGVKVVPDAGRP